MSRCIVTGELLTEENNSRAHIIPNAMGGRFRPKGVLSRDANSWIGQHIEAPFTDQYGTLMSLLQGERQSGLNPPVGLEDAQGRKYRYVPGKSLSLARPEFKTTPLANDAGESIEIRARTEKEARTLLGRVEKKYPNQSIDKLMQSAQQVAVPATRMKKGLNIGPNILFPVVFAITSTFAAHKSFPIHARFAEFVNALRGDPENSKVRLNWPDDIFYWHPSVGDVFPGKNVTTQAVALIGDPTRRQALSIVSLAGIPMVGVKTPYEEQEKRVESYAIDVSTGETVTLEVNEALILATDWAATHRLGEDALYKLQSKMVTEVLEVAATIGTIKG